MPTINDLLRDARERLDRLDARDVAAELADGGVLVDIRPAAQRVVEGEAPGALVIERNVLEWRCDPVSDARVRQAVDHDVRWIILCSQGYASSLAAASLQRLGLHRATYVIGGYEALRGVVPELRKIAPMRVVRQATAGQGRPWGMTSAARPVCGSDTAETCSASEGSIHSAAPST